MTREIKYQAWCEDYKMMFHDVQLGIKFDDGSVYHFGDFLEPREGDCHKWTLRQFTGLLDKNGKEIFEFDHLNDNYEVRWSNGKYVLHGITTRDIMNCDESTTKDKIITGNRFIQEDPQGGAD